MLEQPDIQVNFVNRLNCTPLHYACKGHTDIVNSLIDYNAQLDIKNKYGETPLHRAVATKKISIIARLLDGKANVNTQNRFVFERENQFKLLITFLFKI